jgi:hypothetical protein
MEIKRDRSKHKICIRQKNHILQAVEKFHLSEEVPQNVKIPMDPSFDPTFDDSVEVVASKVPFRELIGILLYIGRHSRPEILYAVNILCKYFNNTQRKHWMAAKRVLKYLHQSADLWRCLGQKEGVGKLKLAAYADASYASCTETRRSRVGGILTLGGYPIHHTTKLQQTVATSSTEAEYMGLTSIIKDIQFASGLLNELGYAQEETVILWEDNKGAIDLVNTTKHHERAKHIDVQHHYIREVVEKGTVKVQYIPTTEQLADIFTKALGPHKFLKLRDNLGIQFREGVGE